jgi:hypothetical protein
MTYHKIRLARRPVKIGLSPPWRHGLEGPSRFYQPDGLFGNAETKRAAREQLDSAAVWISAFDPKQTLAEPCLFGDPWRGVEVSTVVCRARTRESLP